MSDWQLLIRDRARAALGVLTYARAELRPQFNQPGTWLVEAIPAASSEAAHIARGCGLVVERDGAVFLSGPATRIRRYTNDNGVEMVDISGITDLAYLQVSAHPVPATLNTATQEADVRTGVAETVIKAYVAANVGSSAHSSRKVAGLTIAADTTVGSSVEGRARFQNLIDLLASLALAGGDLGFTLDQDTDSTDLIFDVYDPPDRSNEVVFSIDLGTLAGYDWQVAAPTGNWVDVGGGGEGTARTFRSGGDSASISDWGRRIETFVDRRDTTDLTELDQSRDETLAEQAEQQTLEITPADVSAFVFGDDYGLGDIVTGEIADTPIPLVVRSATIVLEPGKAEQVTPLLATPGALPAGFDLNADRMRRQSRRIRDLERR